MQLLAQAMMTGILNAGIYALIASGLTLVFGVINVVNFAHGAFLMLAMYQSYWLYELWRISPYWSLFINIPVFFCIGYVIQKSLVRRVLDSPNYVQLLLTLGIMMVMENAAMLAWGSNPRVVQAQMPSTVSIAGGVVLSLPRLIAFLVAAAMTAGLHFFLARTNTGRAIRAAAQDREKAAMLGIDVRRIYCIAFGIGSACVGVAGALVVPFLYAQPYVGEVFLLVSFTIIIMGGLGNLRGAAVACLLVGLIESVGAVIMPGTTYMVLPLVGLVMVLLFRPQGLLGV